MNTDLTQRARMACEATSAVLARSPRTPSTEMSSGVVAVAPRAEVAPATLIPTARDYRAIPARTRDLFAATAHTGFVPTPVNPCVMSATWLGGNKHEHQRLKERSLP